MIPQVPDTLLLRLRYRLHQLRRRVACGRPGNTVPPTYGLYRQRLWLDRGKR